MTTIALTIAGSDPSGGAGIQADLKTFAAHGVYGASVITALTAQNTTGVFGIHGVPPDFIRAQAEAVLSDLHVDCIKVGMLGDRATIEVVAEILEAHASIPVVLDPVMVTASGDLLLASDAVDTLLQRLLPLARLITPNVHEAGLLLGEPPADSLGAMERQALALRDLGAHAVLLKGGRRGDVSTSTDVLCTADAAEWLEAPRVAIERPHGTGCTLSSAIAAQLALGRALRDAVLEGKRYVTAALERASRVSIGHGSRPLIHADGER
ncbi:Hydroxymethylpyrimidine/phosphomethylpyrimidine kinase [Planctomycetes bacterium Poly30]|uniref:hydroxymethylpyrimidine kinase n=1 Tax=Saltatorellus ferox TaxID=2528018 RepID=A0A518EPU1_9BACT|nr:Hydroxymethylpyrimidine/phosphomethylpyrimidine kinase [Planctomycetes bacterium Poly30]